MNAGGKTVSAWVFVDGNSSSVSSSTCTLSGSTSATLDLGYSATRSPPPARTWFLLTGTFPSTATAEVSLNLNCTLPADTVWYIDDVRID